MQQKLNKNEPLKDLNLLDLTFIKNLGFEMFKSKYGFYGLKKSRIKE